MTDDTVDLNMIDLDDEVDLQVIDDPTAPPPKKERHYAKQALASFMDIPGGLVALPGLVQAGATAVNRLAHGESVEGSMDNALMRTSQRMREGVNDLLGIEEPEGMEQVARLASLVVPTPDKLSKIGSMIAKPGIVQKVGDVVGALAMPFAQYTPKASTAVKAAQIAGQVGVGIAADQGVRALTDQPMALSDPDPEIELEMIDTDPAVDLNLIGDDIQKYRKDNTKEWLVGIGIAAGAALGARQLAKRAKPPNPFPRGAMDPITQHPNDANLTTGQRMHSDMVSSSSAIEDVLRNSGADEDLIDHVKGVAVTDPQKQAEIVRATGRMPDSARTIPIYDQEVALPLSQLTPEERLTWDNGMMAVREKLNRISATFSSYFGKDTFADYAVRQSQYFSKRASASLREADKFERAFDITLQETPDDIGTLNDLQRKMERAQRRHQRYSQAVMDWEMAGDTGIVKGKSGKEYDLNKYWDGTPTAKEMNEFLEDTGVPYKKTGFLVPGKDGEVLADHGQIETMIQGLKNNPKLMQIAKAYTGITDGLMQHAVDQGVMSRRQAAEFRALMTLDDVPFYVPGREAVKELEGVKGLAFKLAKMFGWTTGSAREVRMDIIGNMNKRAEDVGRGIRKPMGADEVLDLYTSAIFSHVHRNKAQKLALDNISEMLSKRAVSREVQRAAAKAGDAPIPEDTLIVRKVGESVDENRDAINEDLVKDLRGKGLEIRGNTITVQNHGRFETWYVSDASLRNALEMSPRLVEGINGLASKFKNIFHAATTRNILFAPTQFLYSTQQLGSTALAHGTHYTPLDAAKGAWQLFSTNAARETAGHFRNLLYKNTNLGQVARPLVEGLVAKLDGIVARSFYDNFNRETGGLHSAYNLREVDTKLPDLSKHYGEVYRDPAAWKVAWRYLSIMHNALQDGPMLGLQMKLANKAAEKAGKSVTALSPADLRRVNVQSKRIGGDFRDLGSSPGARTIASWVPYSGAIIHGWSAIGRAWKKDPAKAAAGLLTYVVAPTIAEMVAWYFLGSEEEKQAYWTRFTDEQRSGSFLMPTGDPNAPAMFRVLPEYSFVRAATIAAIDSLTGFSNDYRGLPGDGNIGPQDPVLRKDHQHAVMSALARAFNIPTPPLVNAALAASTGQQMVIGPTASADDGFLLHMQPLGGVERITGMDRGQSRNANGVWDREIEGVITSLLGFYGSTFAAATEAFNMGSRIGLEEGFEFAAEETGLRMSQYANLTNPFTGAATHTSANDATEQLVRKKTEGLAALVSEGNNRLTGGRIIDRQNMMNFPGDSALPAFDPKLDIISQIAMEHSGINEYPERHVQDLQKAATDIRSTSVIQPFIEDVLPEYTHLIGQPASPSLKRELLDALNLKIKSYRELMLGNLLSVEARMDYALQSNGYGGRAIDLQDTSSFSGVDDLLLSQGSGDVRVP